MKYDFNYNLNLPENVPAILDQDFWIHENIGAEVLTGIREPVKFSAATWIFVKKGECVADLNLINHDIKAPAFVRVENSQILQPKYMSADFKASILVMSKRFRDNLFLFMSNIPLYTIISRHSVAPVPQESLQAIDRFFIECKGIINDKENPYRSQAFLFELTSFIFKTVYKWFDSYKDEVMSNQGRMTDQFLILAQQDFQTRPVIS